jgi:hypothetical protein
MRLSTLSAGLVVVLTLGGSVTLLGQGSSAPGLGTWILDVAKSTYSPGPAPKSQSVRYEAAPNGVKRTIDAVNAKGEKTHSEVILIEGKEVPAPNAPQPTTLTWRRIDDRTTEIVQRVNGKVTVTTRRVVSSDGRTATVTQTGTNAQGQKVNNTLIQTKQQ